MALTDNTRKGQSMQILMFALVLVGLAVGLMSYTQVQTAPQIFGSTMDDVPVISEAQTRADNTANYYVPLSGHYSMAQGVYEVGLDNDRLTGIDQLNSHYENEVADVQSTAQNLFDTYAQDMSFQRCSVNIPDKDLEVGINSSTVNITNEDYSDPFVEVECFSNDLEITTQDNRYEEERTTSNIRFHQLMVITLKGLEAAHEESADVESNNNHYGTVTEESACYLDYSEARDEATEESEASAEQAILNLQDQFETAASDAVYNIGKTDGEKGFFGRAIEFLNPWSSDDGFNWDFNAYYNSTDIEEQSNTLSNCQCLEWGCEGYTNVDTYDYSGYYDQCRHEDEPFGTPDCGAYSGVEHDGDGKCETSNHPPKCDTGYSYNSSSGFCEEDNGDGIEFVCDYSDYYLGVENEECVHVNAGEEATCDSSAAVQQNGNCVHDGSRPDKTCLERPKKAESETYYELKEYTMQSRAEDTKYEIPVGGGWKNLEIQRRYHYDFQNN